MINPQPKGVVQTSDPRSDEQLMEDFCNGDHGAFEVLVLRFQHGLYNFLLRSVQNRSRSEELLQEVFLRLIRSKQSYRSTARFSTWVYTIARNLCVDESRRAKFRRTVSLDGPSAPDRDGENLLERMPMEQISTDDSVEGRRLRKEIIHAVDQLPEDQREVFLMRQLSGMSFKEIGEIVGTSENTVKSRMRYALEKLRVHLKKFYTPTH